MKIGNSAARSPQEQGIIPRSFSMGTGISKPGPPQNRVFTSRKKNGIFNFTFRPKKGANMLAGSVNRSGKGLLILTPLDRLVHGTWEK